MCPGQRQCGRELHKIREKIQYYCLQNSVDYRVSFGSVINNKNLIFGFQLILVSIEKMLWKHLEPSARF